MRVDVKSEQGVTMLMLIVYVVILTMIIGILATVSSNFFANSKDLSNDAQYIIEYNKFAAAFVEDAKKNNYVSSVADASIMTKTTSLTFPDGTRYVYDKASETIYRNDVKIVDNISFCEFTIGNIPPQNGHPEVTITKNYVDVELDIHDDKVFTVKSRYVLKYW